MVLPNLPLDVWKDILLRVPAESLVHFKRVCKGWYGLIDSDRFAESHLERWRPRAMMLCRGTPDILVPLRFEGEQLKSHHSEPWLRDCLVNALPQLREGLARTRLGAQPLVLDSCDGLILYKVVCSGGLADQLLVCNPITKSLVRLPHCNSFIINHLGWTITGNGASSQEYKIIGIPVTHRIWLSRLMTCFIFYLPRGGGREPSSWKELHMDVPWNCFSRVLSPILSIGSKVHWLIELEEIAETVLLSLDLSTESLSQPRIVSDMPSFKDGADSWLYSDRAMCLLLTSDLELWVLEDLDSQPIWCKRDMLTRPPEGSKYKTRWTGIYMEAEGKIVIDDGLVYSASTRLWSKMIDFDSAYGLR